MSDANNETRPPQNGEISLLGLPQLFPGESEAERDYLIDAIRSVYGSGDRINELFISDAISHTLELWSLRRVKNDYIQSRRNTGLRRLLPALLPPSNMAVPEMKAEEMADSWARRDKRATADIEKMLSAAGVSWALILAEGIAASLSSIEKLDKLIADTEKRRNAAIAELERRRTLSGRRNGAVEIAETDYDGRGRTA